LRIKKNVLLQAKEELLPPWGAGWQPSNYLTCTHCRYRNGDFALEIAVSRAFVAYSFT
jgi:hypothetical protein